MRAGGGGLGLIALGFCSGVREAGSNRRWPERRALSSVCSEVREAGSNRRDAMRVLGIETSCDETAAAVVADDFRILSNVVASQEAVHAPYGGVVPELASRRHLEVIVPVVEKALADAGVGLADLDRIAVTQGPGLVGSLLVGCSLAKALAPAPDQPLAGANPPEG